MESGYVLVADFDSVGEVELMDFIGCFAVAVFEQLCVGGGLLDDNIDALAFAFGHDAEP